MQLLKIIWSPVSWVYSWVVYLRNCLYNIGFFPSKTFSTPTICIGNLSLGGTGKTPMIEFLISLLKDTYKITVLSRGYGRKSKGYLLATANATVEELGDEPFQIYTKFPEVSLVVDADRCSAITKIEESIYPEIILLDDAYQHRKVVPSFSILLTAYGDLYVDDAYVPSGTLRDHKKEAKRANLIVVTKCPKDLSEAAQLHIKNKINPRDYQQVLFSFLAYDTMLKGIGKSIPLSSLKNKKVTLVTGIANPKPLTKFLKFADISFEHLAYRDHHFFTNEQLTMFKTKEIILTTEKDYVRLKGKIENVYYITIEHQFLGNGRDIIEKELLALL